MSDCPAPWEHEGYRAAFRQMQETSEVRRKMDYELAQRIREYEAEIEEYRAGKLAGEPAYDNPSRDPH